MANQHLFADRAANFELNAIRKMFGQMARPNMISFAGGLPAPDLFPTAELSEISQYVLATEPHIALQYGQTPGDPRLRAWLQQRLAERHNMQFDLDQLMITTGSTQGIYLVATMLVNPGDVVAMEAPSYLGAFASVAAHQGTRVGIQMDDDGLDVDALEALVKQQPIKYMYTIPEFQNPSGRTMTLARRLRLIELAEQYDFMIVEDVPYSDLRFEGEAQPTIFSLDPNQRTIYLGSFSKTLSPMRVGYMVAPQDMSMKLLAAKAPLDACTSTLTQSLVYHFCDRGLLDPQITKINAAYKMKRDTMFSALDRAMPAGVEWTEPEGGMFVWLRAPDHINTEALFLEAVEQNVGFVHGRAFYPDESNAPSNEMRLTFVSESAENINTGLTRLGDLIRKAS